MHSPRPSSGPPCSSIACCTADRTSSGWRSARWPARRRVGALVSGFLVRLTGLRLVTARWPGAERSAGCWPCPPGRPTRRSNSGARAGWLWARVRPDGHAAVHRGRRGGRSHRVRRRVGGRDGRSDGRHGGRPRDPDRVRLDDDRPAERPGLRLARRVPAVHPGGAARSAVAGPAGRGRPRRWASSEAASIMVGLFLVAAAVTAVAIPPSLVLGGRPRMLADEPADAPFGTCRRLRPPMASPARVRPQPLTRNTFGPANRSPSGACRRPATSRARCGSARWSGDTLHESAERSAIERLPEFLRQPETTVWIDLAGPSHEQVETIGDALGAPPADHRGRPGRQPAGEARS